MSTREIALNIVNRLSETELLRFISVYARYVDHTEERQDGKEELAERRAALERMRRISRAVPELDYDKELASYRDERYGR